MGDLMDICSRFFNELNDVCAKYMPKSSKKSKNAGKSGQYEEEKGGSTKIKKPKPYVDPKAPKKPTTNVYLIYCNERRPHLLEERPGRALPDCKSKLTSLFHMKDLKNDPKGLARIAGDEWQSLPEESKKV